MNQSHVAFSGSIPAIYDTCLGPLLFEFPAIDIAERVARAMGNKGRVLEIACGTGISTTYLRDRLPDGIEIVATDLNPGMLEYAEENRGDMPGVRYELADALALPYDDNNFQCVVCQFGIMFFPDIPKSLSEMRRVLSPGGFVACNVWDSFEANPVAGIAHETIAGFFDVEPPSFLEVPFGSCQIEPTLDAFRAQGFQKMKADVVEATIECPSATDIARGFVEGNPGIVEIRERANAEPARIVEALTDEIEKMYGPAPLHIPLREIVFTGYSPD